ncbi:hypothetical protein QHI69_14690 [Burkholderia gladioli pv. gladioli]|uniref:hypothetical protein n=1 Tax=Burkholderia gladioli TaxID=28095 RepID=UPI0012D2A9F6|nr:hypothetical protein [Burkholderia gladioli]MDJ1163144.1 hypothetical protein [Burkholderia gladioli pv. gladioli]
MNSSINYRAYKEISEFLDAINSMNKEVLKSRFGVSEPILDEICESLEDYFGEKSIVDLAPIGEAFSSKRGSRPYIDIFEMDDDKSWGRNACSGWAAKLRNLFCMLSYSKQTMV